METEKVIPPPESREIDDIVEIPFGHWGMFQPVFDRFNSPLPDPTKASILGVLNKEGAVMGALVFGTHMRAEPLWVYPEYENLGIPEKLYAKLDEIIAAHVGSEAVSYFIVADNEAVARKAERLGFNRLPGILLRKDVVKDEGEV
jgi:ribosomal protein S18 acetylase RimI-like enzyme